jgi:hypothetical protein
MDSKKEFKRAELAMKEALKEAKAKKGKKSRPVIEKPKASVSSSVI